MRHLLAPFDPSFWMVISAGVFLALFLGLIVWVYLPSRRAYYTQKAKIPLNEEDSHD
jgi:cbb3-type cytochrome oxidase subunit 3